MELRTLHYFTIVAQEKNITRAAEILNMSQPPLSNQMRNLEEELGVKADEKESGLRRVLNFGHTIGHAVEKLKNFQQILYFPQIFFCVFHQLGASGCFSE